MVNQIIYKKSYHDGCDRFLIRYECLCLYILQKIKCLSCVCVAYLQESETTEKTCCQMVGSSCVYLLSINWYCFLVPFSFLFPLSSSFSFLSSLPFLGYKSALVGGTGYSSRGGRWMTIHCLSGSIGIRHALLSMHY